MSKFDRTTTRLESFDSVSDPTPERQAWEFPSSKTLDGPHAIHTYVAAMNPHLARRLVKDLAPPGGRLLDPFVGGGAVAVEGVHQGMNVTGVDVNPLAVLVSRAKTCHIPKAKLKDALGTVLKEVSTRDADIPIFPPGARIDFWFKPYMIQPLSNLAAAIRGLEEEEVRTAFQVAFSATVRDVSLTYRGEVRLRKLQGKDLDRFDPDVISKFRDRANLLVERISQLPKAPRPEIGPGNAMALDQPAAAFDAVITSPPYGDDRNGVGYFQFSKNMLYWLGFTTDELSRAKSGFLGQDKANRIPPASETVARAVEEIKQNPVPSNPRAVDECIAFYSDYQQSLAEMARTCDGPIAIVIGDRTLSKTFIDNSKITTELMANVGWTLDSYFHRVIEKKRIAVMKPGGGQRDKSGGGLINKEHTLIYRRN